MGFRVFESWEDFKEYNKSYCDYVRVEKVSDGRYYLEDKFGVIDRDMAKSYRLEEIEGEDFWGHPEYIVDTDNLNAILKNEVWLKVVYVSE